jgi:hypothetical protein
MDMLKAKINSNLAHKPKKGLPMDKLQLRQNEFLLHLQGIYALHCSFAILFFFIILSSVLLLSLFLFSFFYSAPLSRGCHSSKSFLRTSKPPPLNHKWFWVHLRKHFTAFATPLNPTPTPKPVALSLEWFWVSRQYNCWT